jgi:hypothetical protein
MRFTTRWLMPALLVGAVSTIAHAQAWLPRQGTTGVEVAFNDTYNRYHYLPNGDEIDAGHTRTQTEYLALNHALTDRVLLAASIPFVGGRYMGNSPHPGTDIDDGHYHGTFTDWRLELHYQLSEWPVALAPYVVLVIPSHHYPSFGHAAPGRDLKEQWLGFYVGKSLDPWIPRTYLQARYNFAFVETVAGVGHDRSNADFELGYFFTPAWSVRAVVSWQRTHGGIDVPIPPTNPLYPHHDQLAAERYLQVGGGAAWNFSKRSSVYVLYKAAVSGANGHKLNSSLTLGWATAFMPKDY